LLLLHTDLLAALMSGVSYCTPEDFLLCCLPLFAEVKMQAWGLKAWLVLVLFCFFLAYGLVPNSY